MTCLASAFQSIVGADRLFAVVVVLNLVLEALYFCIDLMVMEWDYSFSSDQGVLVPLPRVAEFYQG